MIGVGNGVRIITSREQEEQHMGQHNDQQREKQEERHKDQPQEKLVEKKALPGIRKNVGWRHKPLDEPMQAPSGPLSAAPGAGPVANA